MGASFAISWDLTSALVKLADLKYLYIDTFNLVKGILIEPFIWYLGVPTIGYKFRSIG